MKAGDKIRVQMYMMGHKNGCEDFIVEEFRYCLGIFQTTDERTAGEFTPLCDLFESGPYSENEYLSNYGEYTSNKVQAWMDLPRDKG